MSTSDSGQPGEDYDDPLPDDLNVNKIVEEVDLDHSLVHLQGEVFDVWSPTAELLGGTMLASIMEGALRYSTTVSTHARSCSQQP